ncbi:MAG TPA: MucB/RseB C-terminal domain-containing protein [Steroidobacteraceae bacterium]|nr:MucB/RseB C-terminal domain-containing protein [Steroidobacteraceae bacterium]
MTPVPVRKTLACCVLLAAGASAFGAEEPQQLLERMNQALTGRNYVGTFVQLANGRVSTMRILHRVDKGRVMERLVSLDGSGREIVGTADELICYLPDQRKVLVEPRKDQGPLLGTLPSFRPELVGYYTVEAKGSGRVLGHNTQVIAVMPKDDFRFGYRLWLDEVTAMPLKTQLCDSDGRVIEQILFAEIAWPDRIPNSEFKPQLSTEGFTWVRAESPLHLAEIGSDSLLWRAIRLPPGFRLSASSTQPLENPSRPVAHLVYSDGLASVSVFIETNERGQALSGHLSMGSSAAFSTVVNGHQVTAVGEVPARTVELIAGSVQPSRHAQGSSPRP